MGTDFQRETVEMQARLGSDSSFGRTRGAQTPTPAPAQDTAQRGCFPGATHRGLGGRHTRALVGARLHKVRLKVIFSNCVDIKTSMLILYIKTFYLTHFFFLNLREKKTVFGPLKALRAQALPRPFPHPCPVGWRPGPECGPASRTLRRVPCCSLEALFSKLITDHTRVTYTIKEDKLLFLLHNVREFSNLQL